MNLDDFVYPNTASISKNAFTSHAQFLEAGALRYAINVALHNLNIDELKQVLQMIQAEHELTESGER